MSRRMVLIFSFLTALALYAGLYSVSPRIFLLRANSATERLPEPVRVRLLEVPAEPSLEAPTEAPSPMASRPGSVRDLLDREVEELPLAEPEPSLSTPDDLRDRGASEVLEREHDLVQDLDLASGVEAKILAIASDDARGEIEIARRMVKPSPDRLMERGEIPSIRGPGDSSGTGDALSFAELPPSVSGADTDMESEEAQLIEREPAPEWEEGVFLSDFEVVGLPELPDETVMGTEVVRRAIEAESPFEQMDQLVDIKAETYRDPGSGVGYFRLRIFPRADQSVEVLPKDVTFVIDASNSISQRKLDLTVRGLGESLSLLDGSDRFNIVVFRDTPRMFREDLVAVTPESIEAARAFIDGLQSQGSTDLYSAVRPVILNRPRKGIPGVVVVVSDGRPSEGNLAGRVLINALTVENVGRNTIFTFGGGNTVNRYLLDLLAYRNRGMTHVAPRIDDIDEHLPEFIERLSDAILVDLRADYGRIDGDTIFPRELPDFYRGKVVTVYGQYDPDNDRDIVLRLEGLAGDVRKDMVLKADLSDASQGDAGIAREWAFEKSYHLIGEVTRLGETPELMGELRQLSDEYGVRTSYTQ